MDSFKGLKFLWVYLPPPSCLATLGLANGMCIIYKWKWLSVVYGDK